MKKCFPLLVAVFILLQSSVEARRGAQFEIVTLKEEKLEPWFTGPLLAPSGHVVPVGYINIEPYLFATRTPRVYDKDWNTKSIDTIYSLNHQFTLQIGLTEWMDVSLDPQFSWNHTEGVSATRLGDLPTSLDFQLLKDQDGKWWPAIKLALREVFPTGKYQKLNPKKLFMDATGAGTFLTGIGMTISHVYWFGGPHYLAARLGSGYFFPSRVHVEGFNSYGGSFNTRGYVYPGQQLNMVLGLEYSLTRNWVLACDVLYQHVARNRFKGNRGTTPLGTPAPFLKFSSEQFSIAPAIEYNWNANLGIIAGCWFAVAGRNTADFTSIVIALNYYMSVGKERKKVPSPHNK